jgi:hypothetical protein
MKYEEGTQPCADFKAQDDLFLGSGNVHECYHKLNGKQCEGTVSFCTNCFKDHHSGGREGCLCDKLFIP